MKGIGTHLRRLREQSGMSLREFARQVGVHPSNVSFWETRDKLPSSSALIQISEVLGVSVDEVLGKDPGKPPPVRGRFGKLFAEASELPKPKRERIAIVLEDMLAAQKAKAG